MQKILKHNCQELIQSVPFFENAPEAFTTAVLTRLRFELFLPGEYIVRQGFKGDKMYFIQRGVVEVITGDGTVVTHLAEGAHFGEICLLTEERRVASVKSGTMCDLFSLSSHNFLELLEEFPEMRPFFEAIAKTRLGKIDPASTEEDLCDSVSGYRIAGSTKHSPSATCRSLSTALNEEVGCSPSVQPSGKDRGATESKVDKSTSYKKLTTTRSRPSESLSTPHSMGDMEYAQVNPHYVSYEENT